MGVPVELVPEYFRGLPFHPLVIHAVVVLLPLTAIALVLAAFSASLRARLGIFLPLLGILSLVLVPIATSSGEQYKATLNSNGLQNATLERHSELADQVLPWTIGLAVLCIAVYVVLLVGRRLAAPRSAGAAAAPGASSGAGRSRTVALSGRSPVSVVLAVLSVAVAVGLVATVAAVGELGARSVYGG